MPGQSITFEALGWDESWDAAFVGFRAMKLEPARIAVEDKHHFLVLTRAGPLTGQVTGKFLHEAASRALLPKVGDWVAVKILENGVKAAIHGVLPRRTKLSRKVPGRETTEQVLVANVDIAFVVQALDGTFNPALLQRHLLMVTEGGVKAVVVLNKADLCRDILDKLAAVERVASDAPVIAVSAKTGQAMDSLTQLILPGETVVFVGASGVGKSSLINRLYGEEILATTAVRERDSKGRHTTSWREMILLPEGGLVIDTPGMREFHMWLAAEGVQGTFSDVEELALSCHFRQCSHTVEKRCAVLEAIDRGRLPRERYDSYMKPKRELDALGRAVRRRDVLDRKRGSRAARSRR
jgi:ribosome biogenesis GTPase